MYIELYKLNSYQHGEIPTNRELIHTWDFYNNITINHIMLEHLPNTSTNPIEGEKVQKGAKDNSTANNGLPYLLVCYLDMKEMPEYMKVLHNNNGNGNQTDDSLTNIGWVIRVFSSDTLGFVKDSTKDDSEKSLKDSWEISESGRAEKAKKSRLKFILSMRKKKGEVLTLEEEKILNEEREKKTSATINENPVPVGKNNKAAQGNNKVKSKGSNKKVTNANANSNANKNVEEATGNSQPVVIKQLPVPETHTSQFVKDFLSYNYQERTIVFDNKIDQLRSKLYMI